MTENNIFQEIEEDLERQRLEALWKRYGSWVISAAFMLVLGTAGFTAWQSWRTDRNQNATSELIELMHANNTDVSKSIDVLIDYSHKNNKLFQSVMAQLHAADYAAQNGKIAKAIEIYDMIAKDSNVDPTFRQLADLRSVELQLSDAKPEVLSKRLEELSQDKSPWYFTAIEYEGYLALRTGDKEKAKEIFTNLSQNAQAPISLSQRASDILHSLAE